MAGVASQASLAHRTGLALAEALRNHQRRGRAALEPRIRRPADLLLPGLDDEELPDSLDRTRLRSPDSAAALAVNTFLPWQRATDQLPLAGQVGFEAVQFEVRCPTGLRGTPPHLDLLALREQLAVAVTVRCTEYLSRRKSPVADSYDRLLADTSGIDNWREELASLRHASPACRHVDLGALIKYALALARTFPERQTTLLYLFWEPLNAGRFEEFRRHRAELEGLVERTAGARIALAAQSFDQLWHDWSARSTPAWLPEHVARLRRRYCVAIADGHGA